MRPSIKLAAMLSFASLMQLACSGDTHLVVARAPGFDLSGANVSVFGVFSDGRWNAAEWDKLGPRLRSLGAGPCEPGFGEPLRNTDKELYAAIDREARSNGLTEKLLVELSSGAKGDLVLVVELWGALGAISNTSPTAGSPSMGPGGTSGMGGPGVSGGRMRPGGMGGGYGPTAPPPNKPQDALKMVARVYALETSEWVGAVELQYSGNDPNEAVARFDEALGQLLPGSHCSGWEWKPPASAAPSMSTSASPIPATSGSAASP